MTIIKLHLIITLYLLHLWSKYITFMVSQITFMVKILLHLWLGILLHLWLGILLHLWLIFITFMVDYYI